MQKGEYYIFYHYKDGKVTSRMEKYDREILITNTKGGDINDKDNEESKE